MYDGTTKPGLAVGQLTTLSTSLISSFGSYYVSANFAYFSYVAGGRY